jgi:hypothetical protein
MNGKPQKTSHSGMRWDRPGRQRAHFETAPFGEATPDGGLVFGRFIQQAQRVVGLACISCRQPRLSLKSDTDLARWIPTRQRSTVLDHDLPEMAAALEMAA